jgi:hypothetical protein
MYLTPPTAITPPPNNYTSSPYHPPLPLVQLNIHPCPEPPLETNRPLEEVLEELRRVFNDTEIDGLLRQATIRQAEGAYADRDYLLQRVRELGELPWEDARPLVIELLRVLAHLVASVETLWATVAKLEGRLEKLEQFDDDEETPL